MLFLAVQHLINRKKQSLITLLGIMIGTTAFIVMSSFFVGLQNQITDSLVSGDAHIKIYADETDITPEYIQEKMFPGTSVGWIRKPGGTRKSSSIESLGLWDEVFTNSPEYVASTPVFSTSVVIAQNNETWNLNLTGTKPESLIKITNIEDKMIKGSMLDLLKSTGSVIIGEQLAKSIGKEVGESIIVRSTSTGNTFPLKIIGLFNTDNRRADLGSGYVLISDAQKIASKPGAISQISVKVKNFREAADVSNKWKKMSNDYVESWDQAHEGLISMFQSQDTTRYMATGIIMLVASFGIYNILNMIVTQKRKDIAILRSMGYEALDITQLFLVQGLALGIGGGLLGMLLGFIICEAIGTVQFGPPGSKGGFSLDFNMQIYLTAFVISNSAAILASILPSRSAAKLTPIEIIRSGAD